MELHRIYDEDKGSAFQRDIILWAVRWYKYGISYRELQTVAIAERGVNVDHSTIYPLGSALCA
jgi:IS6 family transposase